MHKLKISKTSWMILLVGIFVVALGGLGLTRSQQIRAQDQMDNDLGLAESRLDKLQVKPLSEQVDELQARLEQSKVLLITAKDKLRQPIESIDVTDKLFTTAKSCNVEVITASSSSIKRQTLSGVDCYGINLNAEAAGSVSNLINFVIKLNTDFATGVVESAQISIPDPNTEVQSQPSVKITMEIYSYKGA